MFLHALLFFLLCTSVFGAPVQSTDAVVNPPQPPVQKEPPNVLGRIKNALTFQKVSGVSAKFLTSSGQARPESRP